MASIASTMGHPGGKLLASPLLPRHVGGADAAPVRDDARHHLPSSLYTYVDGIRVALLFYGYKKVIYVY